MSILTLHQPSGSAAPGRPPESRPPADRLVSRPLALVFLAEFCSLVAFCLLFPVVPRYAAAAGAGSSGAGLVTGVLLAGTVVAELAATALMHRYSRRALLVAGLLLLGAPTSALLLPGGSLAVIVGVSAVRGFGFGLSTVITGALVAGLVPPGRRGEGLGLFGVVATAPEIVALPAGVWLASRCGVALVACLAAVSALVPVATFWWLPGRPASPRGRATRPGNRTAAQPAGRPGDGLVAGFRRPDLRRPFLIFVASSAAAGVVVTFLPIATGVSSGVVASGLLVQALTATVSRWWAGRRGDRAGHARLLIPALVVASAGMIMMIWLATPLAVLAGLALLGAGFGVTQNATFALMTERLPESGAGLASAGWNLAYDGGYGAGPAVFGLVVGHTGYAVGFALTGALVLLALPMARRERRNDVEPPAARY